MTDKTFFRIIRLFPNVLFPIKLVLIRKSLGFCGRNVKLPADAIILGQKFIQIYDDVFINSNFYCSTNQGLVIKNRVMFGANCSIIGGDHYYANPHENMRFTEKLGNNYKIIIEEDAWIGHGTLILKNAKIGEGTIVGANSLVNKELLPYSVYTGQPAKFIKPRFQSLSDLELYLNMMKENYNFTSKYSKNDLAELYLS